VRAPHAIVYELTGRSLDIFGGTGVVFADLVKADAEAKGASA